MTYNVFRGTLNLAESINLVTFCNCTLTDNSARGGEGSPFTVFLSNRTDTSIPWHDTRWPLLITVDHSLQWKIAKKDNIKCHLLFSCRDTWHRGV